MDFFDFSLNSVFVKNNRDFGNKAEIKIFSLVTTSNYDLNIFRDIVAAESEDEKIAKIKIAADTILGYREVIEVKNIKSNHFIGFGQNGYSLYRSSNIPDYFDWNLAVIDSDREWRELGNRLLKITSGNNFFNFAKNLIVALGTVTNPQMIAAIKVTEFVTKIVAKELSVNKDDQVGLYCESFNIWQHYPDLNLKGKDIPDMSNNCLISYSLFARRG